MVNKVILIGRLGADPEVRYTQDGMMVTNLRIATNEFRKDKSGERVDRTEWHRVVAFGKLAEICGNYLSKGRLVFIEGNRCGRGSGRTRKADKRSTTEILATTCRCSSRKAAAGKKPRQAAGHPHTAGASRLRTRTYRSRKATG